MVFDKSHPAMAQPAHHSHRVKDTDTDGTRLLKKCVISEVVLNVLAMAHRRDYAIRDSDGPRQTRSVPQLVGRPETEVL
jgi:hypothetical protein